MRLTIEIPSEYTGDWSENRFSDCFNRCITDIKRDSDHRLISGKYEMEILEMLMKAFYNSTVISEKTNLD